MKYVATVEIEFETDDDPLERLQLIMNRTGWVRVGNEWRRSAGAGPYAEHYHIVEQPRELK